MRWHELNLNRRSLFLGTLALLVPLAVGCGKGKGTVSGTVTLDGQPLPAGTINFLPSKGPGAGGSIEDGKYSVANVPAGTMTVTVETDSIKEQMDALAKASQGTPVMGSGSRNLPPQMLAKMPEDARKKWEEGKKQAEEAPKKLKELQAKYRPIPDKYSKAESSGLTFEVKAGPNTIEVPLSSK